MFCCSDRWFVVARGGVALALERRADGRTPAEVPESVA